MCRISFENKICSLFDGYSLLFISFLRELNYGDII